MRDSCDPWGAEARCLASVVSPRVDLLVWPTVAKTTIAAATAATPAAAAVHRRYLVAGPLRALLIAARSAHDSCSEGTGAGSARMSASVARSARSVAEQSEQRVRCCSRSSRPSSLSSPSMYAESCSGSGWVVIVLPLEAPYPRTVPFRED